MSARNYLALLKGYIDPSAFYSLEKKKERNEAVYRTLFIHHNYVARLATSTFN